MNCTAKIRPFPNPTELACEHDGTGWHEHHATLRDYAYPGSATIITWHEADRRTYRGTWQPCTGEECTLPAGHPGRHAT